MRLQTKIIIFIVIALSCTTLSCNRKSTEVLATKFKKAEIYISDSGITKIPIASKVYLNFTDIQKALIYRNKIIGVGSTGGFACLNVSDFKPDTTLEKLMNTDYFSEAGIVNDTLFAGNSEKTFYWDQSKWILYSHPLPINYFTVLFEDKTYIIYEVCQGEFSSLLFAFNKETRVTKALFSRTCPNTVLKSDSGFLIGSHLYHIDSYSRLYNIRDIEKLISVPDSLRFPHTRIDMDSGISKIRNQNKLASKNIRVLKYPRNDIIVSTFISNGNMFYIIDKDLSIGSNKKRYIGTIDNDSMRIIDSLANIDPEITCRYGNTTVINEVHDGFSLIRNDTIYKIKFKPLAVPITGYRFSVIGDFDGDGLPDTLHEHLLNALTLKETNKFYGGISYDSMVDINYAQSPVSCLTSNNKKIDSLFIQSDRLFGISFLKNEGDLDGNGTDEISYVIDVADYSNLNTYHIVTYTSKGWKEVLSFDIRDFDLPDMPGVARLYGLMGTAGFQPGDASDTGIISYEKTIKNFSLIRKVRNGVVKVKTYEEEGDNIGEPVEKVMRLKKVIY
jgi:hypothetical protein